MLLLHHINLCNTLSGDKSPSNSILLFHEHGTNPRRIAVKSQNESEAPLQAFFVNPGENLPENSVFLDEKEVNKIVCARLQSGSFVIDDINPDDDLPRGSIAVKTTDDGVRTIIKSSKGSSLVPHLSRPGRVLPGSFILSCSLDEIDQQITFTPQKK